jgi:hypothetical protein
MTKRHDYDDIPGTFVFDAERSRQGYGINMFCMSLMKEENRKAFQANAEYLKKFNLTPEQTEAILKRDYNRMLAPRLSVSTCTNGLQKCTLSYRDWKRASQNRQYPSKREGQ